MIIILEGPDRGGKTSIGRELYNYLNVVRIKAVKRSRRFALRITKVYLDIFELNKDTDFLCDRLNITSERVYSPLIDQKQVAYTNDQIERAERRLLNLNAMILIVTADQNVIERRYRRLGEDDYVPTDQIRGAIQGYELLAEKTKLPVRWVDTSKGTAKHNVTQAMNHIQQFRKEVRR